MAATGNEQEGLQAGRPPRCGVWSRFTCSRQSASWAMLVTCRFTAHGCLHHLEGVSPSQSPENTQTTCRESLLSARVQVCSCSHFTIIRSSAHLDIVGQTDRHVWRASCSPVPSKMDATQAFCSDFPFWSPDTSMAVPVIANFHHNTGPHFGFCFKTRFLGRLLKKCEPWKVCQDPVPAMFTNR